MKEKLCLFSPTPFLFRGPNPGPCTSWAGALPLSYLPAPCFCFSMWLCLCVYMFGCPCICACVLQCQVTSSVCPLCFSETCLVVNLELTDSFGPAVSRDLPSSIFKHWGYGFGSLRLRTRLSCFRGKRFTAFALTLG